ncbi:oxidoreductase [Methanosalsum natronophilum]|uniref:oxidoreductase n=1 Tax=Methanosalsum natronophilum TaxID=768733 RepID=UPI002169259F|nr:FAD-dependent oxidoreductase [Methanosalsum natronophilum]MCS3923152.1 2-enoate reductase [Methanosalsum natronophilum]
MEFDNLFESGQIGSCKLNNRIIMAPIGNINMVDSNGRPTNKMIEFFRERAKGGCGLLITGLVPVSYGVDPTLLEDNNTTYFPRIDGTSRTRLSGWQDLTSSVRPYGSKIFIQLSAGLGRVGSPEPALKGKLLKSASWNRNFYVPQVPHLPLSNRDIKKIVKSFGQCAINAKISGFDGVQLHGHEGYLMDQLTSNPWNRRIFGRYKDKFRFALDVVKEIKSRCGTDFPIIYRLDLTQAIRETYGESIFKDIFKGKERSIEEGLQFCKALNEAGVDAFDVDKGCYENWFWPHLPSYFDDAVYVEEIAGRLKQFFVSEGINVPVVAVGKLGKPEVASYVLNKNWADFIMLGRPLLADPYWPNKVKTGDVKDIIHCIGDNEGCIESFKKGGHPCCSVNPYMGFEDVKEIKNAEIKKRVCIVGAGPAGCEAALTAHKRSHNVTLFEKSSVIGGQLYLGSKMEMKHDLKRYLDNINHKIERANEQGLTLVFNKEATLGDIKDQFDVIICCNGLKENIPHINGLDKIDHIGARQFISNGMKVPPNKKNILIVGGGNVGCELAYIVAKNKSYNVTIVSKNKNLMPNTTMANRNQMLWLLMGKGSTNGNKKDSLDQAVKAYTASKIIGFSENQVYIFSNKDRKDPYIPWMSLIPENVNNPFEKKLNPEKVEHLNFDVDYVIFATTGVPDDGLYQELKNAQAAREIYQVGDAKEIGLVWGAVSSANEIARNI